VAIENFQIDFNFFFKFVISLFGETSTIEGKKKAKNIANCSG
jgi:hypothetical protein